MERGPTPSTREPDFRGRAFAEAARYGSDPWVFVRELLQNARDAGARRVDFTVSDDGAVERVVCRDDGCGMSFDDARRYLFALYASSKEDNPVAAGRFGIGFWSVLRFAPSAVTIRSRAAGEPAWQVTVDGELERVRVAEEAAIDAGTEVVLERRVSGGRLADDVLAAARRHGRFLRRRDGEEALAVTVNGEPANAELALPPPSAAFSGKGFRGVVALGDKPAVELFAHGLFVRSAASLRDLRELAEQRADTTAEDALAELPSQAPQVLLDSSRLDLLLARSDARQSPHLRRMLQAAEKQLRRLVTRQLQALRPQPWYRLWLGRLRDWLGPVPARTVAAAALAGVLAGTAALWWLPPNPAGPPDGTNRAAREGAGGGVAGGETSGREEASRDEAAPSRWGSPSREPAVGEGAARAGSSPLAARSPAVFRYADLSRRYRGPLAEPAQPAPAAGGGSRLALAYEPAAATLLFNALVIADVSAASWVARPLPAAPSRYRESRCAAPCVDVRLLVAAERGAELRIPVPTGHRLEASSVRLDGAPVDVFETAHGEAVVLPAAGGDGLLEYRTGPAAAPGQNRPPASQPAAAELAAVARRIRSLPFDERVSRAAAYVARRISYRPAGAAGLVADPGGDFVTSALAAGEGDCDVQNGVLLALLRAAGVEARLAVGYVGHRGTAAAGLHAWVEYGDGRGAWQVADASVAEWPHSAAPAAAGVAVPEGRLAATAAPASSPTSRVAVALALAAAVGGLVALLRRRRAGAAEPDLDHDGDLAALLGGALRHPGAFAGLAAIHHGRFVPLVGGGAISLERARRLARERRLFRSAAGSELALAAAARRAAVVDAATAEGRVVSLALGAVDLDHWSRLLGRSREAELSRYVNRLLAELGEPWRLRQAAGLGQPVVEIALEDLGLGRRQILVDLGQPEYRGLGGEPGTEAFTVLDVVVERIGLAERAAARVLAAAAGRALREAHGSCEAHGS